MLADLCSKPVMTVTPKTTIADAARLMRDKRIGALVVTGSAKPVGMLTDRDIAVSVVAEGRDPATVLVGDVMHKSPTVIHADQGIFDAAKTFGARGIRRLPVVDKKGALVGILALDDVLMLLGREMGHVASALSKELGRPAAA
jgi:CBS domain-containing protein